MTGRLVVGRSRVVVNKRAVFSLTVANHISCLLNVIGDILIGVLLVGEGRGESIGFIHVATLADGIVGGLKKSAIGGVVIEASIVADDLVRVL